MTTSLIKITVFKKAKQTLTAVFSYYWYVGFSESKLLSGVCGIPHYVVLVESIWAFSMPLKEAFVYRKDYSEDNLKN